MHVLLRAEFDTNEVKTSLVIAKTKIKPEVKGIRISIPRLELTVLEESTLLGFKLKKPFRRRKGCSTFRLQSSYSPMQQEA